MRSAVMLQKACQSSPEVVACKSTLQPESFRADREIYTKAKKLLPKSECLNSKNVPVAADP
jgi:hypothetical protein